MIKKGKSIIIAAIIGIIICSICLWVGGKVKVIYNNEQNYKELITYKYESDEFCSIIEALNSGNELALFDVISNEKIECAREIDDIRYLILLSETDEKLFIFFDDNYKITSYYYIKGEFLKEDDFANIQTEVTPSSVIFEMDQNRILYPFDVIYITGHITQEGIIIISYSRIRDRKILEDPIVESIEIYKNDEILEMRKDNLIIQYTPYILPIDKQ